MLEQYYPSRVFYYFEQLCAIPHGSGNTKAISDYCVKVANLLGYEAVQDSYNNVIIIKPAYHGFEDRPTVIIQGHLDMVCEKDVDCDLDFMKDGLRLGVDGDWIYAKQTTLGGDDGIAVAMALALLEDKDLPAPALEILFTVDEETGMDGAIGLDASQLKGRILLNIDSEEEGILTVGCAGGARVEAHFELPETKPTAPAYTIIVKGLKGGHSGVEIDKGRYNANIMLGRFLNTLEKVSIARIGGGTKDNAITRTAQAVISTVSDPFEKAEAFVSANANVNDPDFTIVVEKADAQCVYDPSALIRFLSSVPSGVVAMSRDIEGLVETSLNLGIVSMEKGKVRCQFSLRSGINAKRDALREEVMTLARLCGADVTYGGHYPAWEFRKDSPLRDKMVKVYEKLYWQQPQVVTIHAGLECGLFCEKIEGLDAVSFGPDMKDIHTSRERLSISSTARTYEYLRQVLKEL